MKKCESFEESKSAVAGKNGEPCVGVEQEFYQKEWTEGSNIETVNG